MAIKAARTIGDADPRAEDESGASGGVIVLKAKVAIELADELAESPTWRASCWCLPPSLLRDTLSSRVCRLGLTALELNGTRNTKI